MLNHGLECISELLRDLFLTDIQGNLAPWNENLSELMRGTKRLINREISWLSFNDRVLQEADDSDVPILERLRFLGIFSNNRDEFFRVRVATVKRMSLLENRVSRDFVGGTPQLVLNRIQERVLEQQAKFERIYQDILDEMAEHGIHKLNETQLEGKQAEYVTKYFTEKVYPTIIPIMMNQLPDFPHLRDKSIYLAVRMERPEKKPLFALIELPRNQPRFVLLPGKDSRKDWIMMDDVIRVNLNKIFAVFSYESISAHTFKITRDAEMDLDEDVSKSFLEKMKKSLRLRRKGNPVRFVYDSEMPEDLLRFLMKRMKADKQDTLIPGGRYHNFKDFMKFPNVGPASFLNKKVRPLKHPDLVGRPRLMEVIRKKDVLLHYPYQDFGHYLDLLREAAIDPKVRSIHMCLYRVAAQSKVINTLINAVKNGKKVTVVVELQARFDEEANIRWADILQDEGVEVIFGFPNLKVHSKICVITRREQGKDVHYASVGTGNFHESTAKIYSDFTLLSADPRITKEVMRVFEFFDNTIRPNYYFKHLILSPLSTRNRFIRLINTEMKNAKAGLEAHITLKMNSLVDTQLIRKLYDASRAGVKIKLIVRGICSLIPGVKGMSENIEAISIVDKHLEHARVYVFCNGGEPVYYTSSADWMTRNLDHRIEVTCPVYDKDLQQELQDMLDIQWSDTVKARLLTGEQTNQYRKGKKKTSIRSQEALYAYYQKALNSRIKENS